MRFKQFLEDASPDDLPELLKNYRRNLDILIKKDICIYRGMASIDTKTDSKTGLNYKELVPSSNRVSKTGNNLLLTISEGWDVPNRRNSVFACQSREAAKDFGWPYIVIPRDDVKRFAYSPADINMITYSQERDDAYDVIRELQSLLRAAQTVLKMKDETQTKNILEKIIDDYEMHVVREDCDSIFFDVGPEIIRRILKGVDEIRASIRLKEAIQAEIKLHQVEELQMHLENLDTIYPFKLRDISKHITPNDFHVTTHENLADVPFRNARRARDELWWEGHFLIVSSVAEGNKLTLADLGLLV